MDCDISDKNMMYHNALADIYDNLTCNIFAVTAYAIQKNKNLDVEKILLFYDKIFYTCDKIKRSLTCLKGV